MGVLKPTNSAKQLEAVPARRPRERWSPSETLARSNIQKGTHSDYEADLHPPRPLNLREHSHTLDIKGPGLSAPATGSNMGRRAGFQRKLRRSR